MVSHAGKHKFASFIHTEHERGNFIRGEPTPLQPDHKSISASQSTMEGYAKVAQLMATQEEFAILRRFRVINMQRLLYLQAEISHLEVEFSQLAKRDELHAERRYHAKDWWSLSQGADVEDLEQWDKFLELSRKLEHYSWYSQ